MIKEFQVDDGNDRLVFYFLCQKPIHRFVMMKTFIEFKFVEAHKEYGLDLHQADDYKGMLKLLI
jgi:hypothetical protein